MATTPVRPGRLLSGPFLGTEVVRAGLVTRRQLDGASWRRLFRDVYVSARADVDHLLMVRAAGLILPEGAAVSGRSAALLWGVRWEYDGDVDVRAARRFGPVRGLAIRSGPLGIDEITKRWGVPVCTAPHTAWELARTLPELDAVAWVDALARSRVITRKRLVAHAMAHEGQMGSVRAARTLALCDPRAESPPESHLRVHMVRAGVPTPVLQYEVLDGGQVLARVDFAWPRIRLAVEYDGDWHGAGRQVSIDRMRLRALNRIGWRVFPVTKGDMPRIGDVLGELKDVIATRIPH